MFSASWRAALRYPAIRLLVLLIVAGAISVLQGRDNNWDLRNYHLYVPFALLEGRFGIDLMPAGQQSNFNPLLDVPYYLVAVSWLPEWPRLVAFLSGLPFGLFAFLVFEICDALTATLPGLPDAHRRRVASAPALLAAVFGLSGSTIVSEIGTTCGDILIGILILAGLLFVLRALVGEGGGSVWHRASLLAGLCLGLAAGLKPTAVLYAPALSLALVFAALQAGRGRGAALSGFLVICLGWGVAFAASWGWWGWAVYQRYDNPLFPLMNNVFHSAWGLPDSLEDVRFLPRNALQAIAYPFFWLQGRVHVASETPVADPRFALAWLAIVALAIRAAWGFAGKNRLALPPASILILSFAVIAFALWEFQFAILRYVIVLEALTGAILLIAFSAFGWTQARRFLPGLAVLLIVVMAVTGKQNWGRLRPYGERVFEISAPALPDSAVVATASQPAAYVLPFLQGRDLAFAGLVGVPPETRLWEETSRLLRSGRPLYLVRIPSQTDSAVSTAAFGLVMDEGKCVALAGRLRPGVELCPARPQ